MNIEEYRNYCLTFSGVTEEFPFDEQTLTFKVGGKIFALTNVDLFASINLKCDPQLAIKLREEYKSVLPGYHMNKKHWNTILIDGSIPDSKIRELILFSYNLVIKNLPKKIRMTLQNKI